MNAVIQPLPYPPADTASAPPVWPSTPRPMRARALGALLIAEGLLALAPIAILGPAIGWPASLDKPAAEQLAAIAAAPGAVTAGYAVYLLYSILIAPVMIALAARLHGGLASPLGMTVAAFAALSALARSIGILRWLTVMPALATAHAGADVAGRAQIEQLFSALTSYGGGIGELLGVSLFMALAVGTLSAGALRQGSLPRPLALGGLACAALLVTPLLPALRLPVAVPMAVVVTLLTVWMLACGAWLLRRRRAD